MRGHGASGCPINNLIPEWNDLVYRGQWREALERLHKTNNFPEFTGRVCPAPCEGSCVLGINEPAVTIKSIECAIIDKGFDEGWVVAEPPEMRTGKKVAVVGSGPAGLAGAAAAQPRRPHGHRVRARRPHRRPADVRHPEHEAREERRRPAREADGAGRRQLRHQRLRSARTYPTAKLQAEFDAVVLCGGATAARDLPVEGRNLKGVHFAMEFLLKSCKSLLDSNFADRQFIDAKGKNVIVIGGGDTGTDCVGTSLRHGCKSLVQFEILPRPPDDARGRQPVAAVAARSTSSTTARRRRRRCSAATRAATSRSPSASSATRGGNLKELHTVEVEWVKNGDGRFAMKEKPGSEKVWPAELVLLAMGFVGPEKDGLLAELGVALDARGNVAADDDKATSVQGRVRRRRHVARPVADRVGDRGRPRRGARRRPLPDGRDAAAVNLARSRGVP